MPRISFLFVVLASALSARMMAPAGAVPPPPEQSSANCDTPTYASDHLVCGDPALLTLDRKMVDLLAAVRSAVSREALPWFEPQDAWFRRRSLCAFSERHAGCLRAAYTERIDLLTALAGAGPGQGAGSFGMICPGAPWGNGSVRLHAPDRGAITVRDGRGQLLMVASASKPQDDWTPFVRLGAQGSSFLIEPSGEPPLHCRITSAPRSSWPPAQRLP